MTIAMKDVKQAMAAVWHGEAYDDYNELYAALRTLAKHGLISWDDMDKIWKYDTVLFNETNDSK